MIKGMELEDIARQPVWKTMSPMLKRLCHVFIESGCDETAMLNAAQYFQKYRNKTSSEILNIPEVREVVALHHGEEEQTPLKAEDFDPPLDLVRAGLKR